MSWEAWGTPPDPEPECCPMCGSQTHEAGCPLCEVDQRRIKAESDLSRVRGVLRELVEARDAASALISGRAKGSFIEAMDRVTKADAAARAELGEKP